MLSLLDHRGHACDELGECLGGKKGFFQTGICKTLGTGGKSGTNS